MFGTQQRICVADTNSNVVLNCLFSSKKKSLKYCLCVSCKACGTTMTNSQLSNDKKKFAKIIDIFNKENHCILLLYTEREVK